MAHYCVEHKTPFFKSPKMRGYAHPIVDDEGEPTGKWCNEPKEQAEAQASQAQKQWGGKSPEERISIERQVSAKIAYDKAAADEPIEVTLAKAEVIYNWIHFHSLLTPSEVNPTTSAVNKVLQPLGMAIPEGEEPAPVKGKPVVYATQQQKDTLLAFEKKHSGKAQELMDKHGFKKKLTKANADILIDEFVVLEDAK